MEETSVGDISIEAGLAGDHKGAKFPERAITVLSREAWEEALSTLGPDIRLPWTVRRANLLVEGVLLPRARGGVLTVGPVKLEVTRPTMPCKRMDEAMPGLLKALYPDWRGGVTCRVLKGGKVTIDDPVEILLSPPERKIKLPG